MKPISFCLRCLLPAAGLLALASCGGNADAEFFNGEIRFFNDRGVAVQHLESHSVDQDSAPMGIVSVYDSLILCWTPQLPDFFTTFITPIRAESWALSSARGGDPGRRFL